MHTAHVAGCLHKLVGQVADGYLSGEGLRSLAWSSRTWLCVTTEYGAVAWRSIDQNYRSHRNRTPSQKVESTQGRSHENENAAPMISVSFDE